MFFLFGLAYLMQIGAFQGFLFTNLIPSEFFLIQLFSNWWD